MAGVDVDDDGSLAEDMMSVEALLGHNVVHMVRDNLILDLLRTYSSDRDRVQRVVSELQRTYDKEDDIDLLMENDIDDALLLALSSPYLDSPGDHTTNAQNDSAKDAPSTSSRGDITSSKSTHISDSNSKKSRLDPVLTPAKLIVGADLLNNPLVDEAGTSSKGFSSALDESALSFVSAEDSFSNHRRRDINRDSSTTSSDNDSEPEVIPIHEEIRKRKKFHGSKSPEKKTKVEFVDLVQSSSNTNHEYLNMLKAMFPDADPGFLVEKLKHIDNELELNTLAASLVETNNYPRIGTGAVNYSGAGPSTSSYSNSSVILKPSSFEVLGTNEPQPGTSSNVHISGSTSVISEPENEGKPDQEPQFMNSNEAVSTLGACETIPCVQQHDDADIHNLSGEMVVASLPDIEIPATVAKLVASLPNQVEVEEPESTPSSTSPTIKNVPDSVPSPILTLPVPESPFELMVTNISNSTNTASETFLPRLSLTPEPLDSPNNCQIVKHPDSGFENNMIACIEELPGTSGTNSKNNIEEPWTEKYSILLCLFPDSDPKYLEEKAKLLHDKDIDFNLFVETSLEQVANQHPFEFRRENNMYPRNSPDLVTVTFEGPSVVKSAVPPPRPPPPRPPPPISIGTVSKSNTGKPTTSKTKGPTEKNATVAGPSRTTVPGPSSTVTSGSSRSTAPGPNCTVTSVSSRSTVPGPSSTVTSASSRPTAPGPSSTVTSGSSRSTVPGPSSTVTSGSRGPSSTVTSGSSRSTAPGPSSTVTSGSSRSTAPGPSSTVTSGSSGPSSTVTSGSSLSTASGPSSTSSSVSVAGTSSANIAGPSSVDDSSSEVCPWSEKQSFLQSILPDADPTYLEEKARTLYDKEEDLRTFVANALENKDYPTLKDYQRRQEIIERQNKYLNDFNIENFLEIVPEPFKHFSQANRESSSHNSDLGLLVLKRKYRLIRSNDIQAIYRKNKFNLTNTCHELDNFKGIPLKSRRPDFQIADRLRDANVSLQFLQEVAFIENQQKIKKYLKNKEDEEARALKEAREKGELLTCNCCFDDEVLTRNIVTCPEGHIFCKSCVRMGAETKIGDGLTKIACLTNCQSEFTLQSLQGVLKPTVFSKLAQRKQVEEIQAAGIEDLVQCPFCDFCNIPGTGDKVFRCLNPDCMKNSCILCKEESHIPLRCDEVEKSSEVKMRTYIEDKMTEALVRTCWKCHRKFVKIDGCNKMTCQCGALMCYICRQPVKDYSHFNGQGGDAFHKCPLFSDNNSLHADAVERVAAEAKAELAQKHPGLSLKHDPTMVPIAREAGGRHPGQIPLAAPPVLPRPVAHRPVFLQRHANYFAQQLMNRFNANQNPFAMPVYAGNAPPPPPPPPPPQLLLPPRAAPFGVPNDRAPYPLPNQPPLPPPPRAPPIGPPNDRAPYPPPPHPPRAPPLGPPNDRAPYPPPHHPHHHHRNERRQRNRDLMVEVGRFAAALERRTNQLGDRLDRPHNLEAGALFRRNPNARQDVAPVAAHDAQDVAAVVNRIDWYGQGYRDHHRYRNHPN